MRRRLRVLVDVLVVVLVYLRIIRAPDDCRRTRPRWRPPLN